MTPPDAVPEAEPVPVGQAQYRDGPPAAVADFAGLDADDTGGASVASFDDLDETAGTPHVRPDLLGHDSTDGVDDVPGPDTREASSPGALDESFADVGVSDSDGPATVRTVSLDDLSAVGGVADGGVADGGDEGGSSGVRVASFDGRRPSAGRSSRPRSERSRTSTRRGAAPDSGATGVPGPAGDGSRSAEPDTAGPGDARPRGGRDKRPGGSSRGGRSGGGLSFSPQDDDARAKEICLRLLTDRSRTVQELSQALRRKEIPDEVAQRVLERFDEVGLVDDEAFAGQWVRSRHRQRGLGRRAIAAELHRKGVAKEIADEALTEIDAESEEARARELVDRKLRTVPIATKEQRVTAARRLVGMLARKGYGGNIAYRVVREAIAARGAEEDELGEGPFDD